MRFLIDMNLSPKWVEFLTNSGHEAAHWVDIGAPDAPPGATGSRPLRERPGTDPTGREKKCPSGRCPVTQHRHGSGASPGRRDAGAASPVDALDVDAAVPARAPGASASGCFCDPVLLPQGVERAVGL